mmetsp:Transcript_7405/g.20024  ORF Transcript_7405/g.20024 Transcript_7405/m.20024 type:complete len:406 (-) Transcript_7405:52-1269(-)|eukprot:CAMPEP_0171214574 /NCGR_PEP_ID=MMETSP0790-20130122/31227_1 /TAXON_ID=2925 /ORGANISM="Alexandrium catenella, Strain OF101" /LENGTH=405 /DNA_ID=CAMNT_0011680311 /DNA_START=63 /DNA_END=1280 /DNA_ORIENTATION=+
MGSTCSSCFDQNTEAKLTVLEPETSPEATKVAKITDQPAEAIETTDAPIDVPEDVGGKREEVVEDAPQAAAGGKFTLVLHSAVINRSFAKIGHMDPYAIIEVEDKEVGRSKPDKSAHKKPHWESSFSWAGEGVPKDIHIAVWDKNDFHRDVFIGAVTIPCSYDMGEQKDIAFTITKRSEATGTIKLSIGYAYPERVKEPALSTRPQTLGMELDKIVKHFSQPSPDTQVELEETTIHRQKSWVKEPDEEKPKLERRPSRLTRDETQSALQPLMGSWKCVETHGLDAFLKATGVGVFQRKIAGAAKWPAWEYQLEGDQVKFTNHSAIGVLLEIFPLRKDYDWKDGHGNPMSCKAVWTKSDEGGTLSTERTGKLASYKEERKITDNRLEFTLTHGSGVAWGRVFEKVL